MGRAARLRMGQYGPATSDVPPTAPAAALAIPGTTVSSWLYNAATGNLSQSQVNALVAQQSSDLQKAGMPADQSQAQAKQDVMNTLASFVGPGAFGITWQGALPGGPDWTTGIGAWLAANWPWLALGGVGIWWVSKRL